MSKSVSTLTPLDGATNPADEKEHKRAEHESKASCSCPKCSLYKWYPPLLLLSTVMAGVFCWMYIQKPVYYSAPGDVKPIGAQPAFQDGAPRNAPGVGTPPTAEKSGELDPELASLPGEPEVGIGVEGSEQPSGGTLKPLIVKRNGQPLFMPLEMVDQTGTEPVVEGETNAANDQAVEENDAADEAEVVAADGEEESEALVSEKEDGKEAYRVPASIIAEFTAGSEGR